ncbi:MAG: polysaccharide export [Geobacteraceae bacterium]|nr:MAG: polysaccharide export [Geobacteraceae bacterium]
MNVVTKSSVIMGLLFLMCISVFSAFAEDLPNGLEDSGFDDNIGMEALPASGGGKSAGLPGASMGEAGGGKEATDPNLMMELRKAYEKGMSGAEGITTGEAPQIVPKIMLKIEPGDGLAALSWTVTNLPQKADDSPLKYTIFVGTESGLPRKKIAVGTVTDYKLRGLKNNQVYFVQVQAASKDNKVFVSSGEERFAPVTEEESGSPLEKTFARESVTLQDKIEARPFKRKLRQFGYDFFKFSQASAASLDTLPVGSDYIIGPGDSLRIDLWGGMQARYDANVDRNGEISIPKIGNVKVWGLSYGQAKEVINKAISRIYKNYDLNVTLGKLRTIQVFVVGEVKAPGTYRVSSLATTINALSAAGGPSLNGSLRKINLLKEGKVVQQIDLYDMFLSGDRSKDVRLENGDTLFVPVIGPVVAVAGEVKRPGIYELKDKTALPQVLATAGGITAAGDTGRIQVERIEGNSARIALDYEPKGQSLDVDLAGVEVFDRDMVKVFPVNEAVRKVVSLKGNVARPGDYQFRAGMRITDVIPSFAVLLPDSYLEAGEVARLVPPDLHREILSFNLKKALDGDAEENLLLQEQDTVKVFSRWEMQEKPTVSINGQVVNPGTFDFYPRMTVRDLVTAAGSLKRNAYLSNAELTRIVVENGKANATRIGIDLGKALAGDPQQNMELHPDDVLIVRGIVDWLEATDRFVTLSGEVKFPGVYSIAKGERLSSVISRAGGYSDKAYLRGAKFTRKSVQESQQKRMNEVIARTENDIMQKQGELAALSASKEELDATRAALEGLMKGLDKLRTVKAEGRVVLHLASLDELQKSPYDLELQGGDTLKIPQTPSVVSVMGQVYNQTTLVYLPAKNIGFYLKKSGGPTRDAEEDEMYLIKADGSVMSRQQSSSGIRWDDDARSWTFGGFMSTTMDPGDTLVVPQRLERIAWMRNIKDITTILSQIALTAGVILAAGL